MGRRRVAALLLAPSLAGLTGLSGCSQGGNETTVVVSPDLTAPPSDPGSDDSSASASAPTETATDSETDAGSPRFEADGVPDVVGTVATGLQAPWGLDFLPDGRAVVTERDTARVLVVAPDDSGSGEGTVTEVGTIPEASPRGEAGLLGVAVSPRFDRDRALYFYVCTAEDNRVVRATLRGDRLGEPRPVLTGIPDGFIHDGGRLAFGPDGYLYVSTGETGEPSLARDRDSYAGKILRITTDGDPAPGNPFGTAVWSWGHRNVEGLAFDDRGRLWASEFGQDTADELNRIVAGEDYGWPVVEGAGGPAEYAAPALTWSTDEASPAGLAFTDGHLWMAALRGQRLWRIDVSGNRASDPTAYLVGEYGRLRTVAVAPDGRLWLATSNRDGRGEPADGDDRILLIDP
ncbi:PQQ-dependent sugar dehydrogenase [Nocardioides sp. GY 10113]|uniref:PQQ-dependent sugar dehydrogenase n=1 Tax=Nocardioides sp. GY 10113 TaxID=2569761 RepID=UPI0010A8377E|nr:PQQ-dependent sugar dehydrogenase [Nocardioides sp. GY 10113]TIC87973.1 PQQ-dependent sugar dehydrogenase [Nocardioides sp. GY 10113]